MAAHISGKVVIAGHTRQKGGEVLDLGFLKLIDTDAFGSGWLTALEVHTGEVIQTNQRGEVRSNKPIQREATAVFNDRRTADSGQLDQPGL
jgi:serine/threonine protein phosphatase 1